MGGTSPCNYGSPQECVHEGTGDRDLSHKQFTQNILRSKLQGLISKIQTNFNLWD